ncbi:MAG: HD domain-containing protein [Lachnospiraceae bacterium]|nr:HD domain-containing protein [Lachnospiraceae bacterium]
MTFIELYNSEPFIKVFKEIENFTETKLKKYNTKFNHKSLGDGKEIFDAVWGNVEFSGGEIYILDSPLLQRLRKIKQLGLAYFVYCGSDYSRFYHTIGVTYLADRMVTSLNKSRNESEIDEEKKQYFRVIVRLASIFHDVGHMFLSHVSEHYFGRSPLYRRHMLIESMLGEFEKKARKSVSLHELLSCMMVNTKEVRKLLKNVTTKLNCDIISKKDYNLDDLVEYISSLIVGVPIDGEIFPYHNIVNGSIDADKCDYLSRDSHVTRVPVAVDISRITQKLSVIETTEDDINKSDLWNEDADKKEKIYELAMKDSAEKALFQLCIARTILFESVYYHHKVLTAETEFRSILNELSNLNKPIFNTFDEILSFSDDEFNSYFFNILKRGKDDEDKNRIDMIRKQLLKLNERELAKRIVCFMPDYLEGDQSNKEALFDSVLVTIGSREEESLLYEVKTDYIKIRTLLNKNKLNITDINIFVIQAPVNIYGHSKIQVPIKMHNGIPRDFRGYEIIDSRETSSSASFVVTDEDEKLLVFFALEKVIYRKFNIRLKVECMSCAKFEQMDMAKNCKALFEQGYYNDTPELIRDELINKYISKDRISKIEKKFKSYEGPDGYQLSESSIKLFYKQIMSACKNKNQCKNIIDGIYVLFEKSLVIDRGYFGKVKAKISELDINEKVLYVVPLGGPRDSAMHISYFWNDIKFDELSIQTVTSLEKMLESYDTDYVMFFDDGSFSGIQSISIIQEYMGIVGKDIKTQEKHVEALNENLREKLRRKKIIFFFLAFNKSNEKRLRDEMNSIGLTNLQFVYVEDLSLKCLEKKEDSIFKDEDQRKVVKDFLYDIGLEIMYSCKKEDDKYKDGWNEIRIKEAALGYNDAQQMVFLKSSVPTYTITAFWQEKGLVNGWTWQPLFKRTQKDN